MTAIEHGTPGRYAHHRCRCSLCRQAWAAYMRLYRRRTRCRCLVYGHGLTRTIVPRRDCHKHGERADPYAAELAAVLEAERAKREPYNRMRRERRP